MASINYIAPNGTSCCIPISTTQQTHPSLAFVDPNGTTQYIALTTAAVQGTPHIYIGNTDYAMGVEEECGGVRIHSDYMCVDCCYNYNTTVCYCFCTDDSDWDFVLGLNPTYGTGSNGWATVTWNSKNCTGTSPTISEFFACMAAHSTAANAITYWGTTMPACWEYTNNCIAAGCDLDPKDGSSHLCVAVGVVVSDNCYWSQESDYCWQVWNNYSGWASCTWSHQNCCPPTCWTSIDYIGYDLNRTSGTVSVGSNTAGAAGCRCVSNVVTTYCNWTQCSEESCGCWQCYGYLTCYNLGPLCMSVYGSIPNGSVRVCNYGCCWNNGIGGVCVVIPSTANTWTGGTGNYNWANPSFRMDAGQGGAHSCWNYSACTSEYSCTSICCSCFQGNPWGCCTMDYYTPNLALIATGRWSDGTQSWTPPNRYACFRACILTCQCNWGQTCCCYCYVVYSCWGGSKNWQNWTAPTMVHCAW